MEELVDLAGDRSSVGIVVAWLIDVGEHQVVPHHDAQLVAELEELGLFVHADAGDPQHVGAGPHHLFERAAQGVAVAVSRTGSRGPSRRRGRRPDPVDDNANPSSD